MRIVPPDVPTATYKPSGESASAVSAVPVAEKSVSMESTVHSLSSPVSGSKDSGSGEDERSEADE